MSAMLQEKLILMAGVVLVLGCVSTKRPTLLVRRSDTSWRGDIAAGCWHFTKAPKAVRERVPESSVIVLTLNPVRWQADTIAPRRFLVRVSPSNGNASSVRTSAWGVDSLRQNRVYVRLGTPLNGIELDGRLIADTMTGSARPYSDFPLSITMARGFRAVRGVCTS
jgi:hypothetical protein